MENDALTLLAGLGGRQRDIASTVRREINAIAPYAELSVVLGVPTWSVHYRVVSILPIAGRCNLHFWQGARLEHVLPDRLEGTGAGGIRYVALRSLLDVDRGVRHLLREAFALNLQDLAREEGAVAGKEALLH